MLLKYNKEVKYSHLDSMQLCQVGVEIHFKKANGCYENGKASKCRQKRGKVGNNSSCWICFATRGVKPAE